MRRRPNQDRVLTGVVLFAGVFLTFAAGVSAQTDTTKVVIRVLAHDAKIVGSGVGGAMVTIRDIETGEVLAEGLQEGGTGDTELIMREPWDRGGIRFDTEGAGAFHAHLELERPTVVEILAEGPLASPPEERYKASKTMLLVPGRDVVGEGIVLELNGFTVQVLEPEGDQAWRGLVNARVTMLCGCPTEPEGLWDSDRFEIWAEFVPDDGDPVRVDLEFAGETSHFNGRLGGAAGQGATGELTVFVSDPERGNFGLTRVSIGR